MQDFKNLRVWQAALQLGLEVHSSCDPKRFSQFPGKRAQILRCVDSIASNIAEGSAKGPREFARYLDMSLASAKELENHLIFAVRANLLPEHRFFRLNAQLEYVRRMLINLIRAVRG